MNLAALVLALIVSTPAAEADPRPTILDFHSTHCGPCQQMRPEIERLVQHRYPVKSINIDLAPDWAERYRVTAVPTFIVVDAQGRSLARTEGYQPAGQLAALYRQARAKLTPDRPVALAADDDAAPAEEATPAEAPTETDEPQDDRGGNPPTAPPAKKAPKPWETVVRIKVHGSNSVGFGSGTIIHSTPEESIILTCAHIFHLETGAQVPPSRFPRKITVDLFDGILRGQMVHPTETVAGQAIDYDFVHDVGLLRIRPGRRMASSPVVPASWRPKAGMGLTTVGCSQGNDATAWSTRVVQPSFGGRGDGRPVYEGTLCVSAPKQGRSGGGLYTGDGYVAGVCDFADYERDRGIYASPQSIHRILARNGLKALYDPDASPSGPLLVRDRPATRPAAESITLRGQSPDRAEPRAKAITIPKPDLLGIPAPAVAAADGRARPRGSWSSSPHARIEPEADPQTADLKMDPSVADDPAASGPAPDPSPAQPRVASPGKWRAVKKPHKMAELDEK